HPNLLAKDRAGIDVVDLKDSGKVEIEHRVRNFAQAEIMTVTIYNADLRRRIKDPDRVLDEIRSDAVVVIQGKNIAAARNGYPGVTRPGQAQVLLIQYEVAGAPEHLEYLQGSRFVRSVIDND